jgi:hypothetical protein
MLQNRNHESDCIVTTVPETGNASDTENSKSEMQAFSSSSKESAAGSIVKVLQVAEHNVKGTDTYHDNCLSYPFQCARRSRQEDNAHLQALLDSLCCPLSRVIFSN